MSLSSGDLIEESASFMFFVLSINKDYTMTYVTLPMLNPVVRKYGFETEHRLQHWLKVSCKARYKL
jgi:hypothetical protein